jgi:hypothetical protein
MIKRQYRYTPDRRAYIKSPPGKPTGRLQTAHIDATYIFAEDEMEAYERLTNGTEESDWPEFDDMPEGWAIP